LSGSIDLDQKAVYSDQINSEQLTIEDEK